MPDLSKLFALPPYGLANREKESMLTELLLELTEHHRQNCAPYRNILAAQGYSPEAIASAVDLPYLPVGLFKALDLRSVADEKVQRTITSSGTSGQQVSRIYLDAHTSELQRMALAHILTDFLGKERLPMLVIDCPSVLRDRKQFSARGAGILGFSIVGRGRTFALTDGMELDLAAVEAFLSENGDRPFFVFGFTFMVWEHFYKALLRQGKRLDMANGVLIHGGGWKTLVEKAVSPEIFHSLLEEACGLRHIHNYYGMAEQTGSIFMQCEAGHFHCSNFSQVQVRNPLDFSPCGVGEVGILQCLSVLPHSYPGHNLLTEDEGVLLGEVNCPCGRRGRTFSVLGRLKDAELRGCSDTYANSF